MTRSSTVGAEQQLLDGPLALGRSIELTPRSRSGASVADCMPMVARERYFFGHTATAAAPSAMHSSSGTTNHHLRRLTAAM
jgi:hypothetical protein